MRYFAKRGWHMVALPDPASRRRKPRALTAAGKRVLRRLCGGPRTLTELCRLCKKSYVAVYALVRRLRALGLVEASRLTPRSRGLTVGLTEAGREALE